MDWLDGPKFPGSGSLSFSNCRVLFFLLLGKGEKEISGGDNYYILEFEIDLIHNAGNYAVLQQSCLQI